ncbi:MAG: chitobiase/beta-hexosaminidase C-terminal domain-containing protein [Desulfobacteraceae bacterium]|nr:chitobiase/beta-hexosaminidase C-terminal domain-containing protein [Desulfobacteraceae bacterium]
MTRKIGFPLLLVGILFIFIVTGCGGGGGSTETGNPSYVSGVVQKGPFYKGATVVIKELNDADLQPSGVEHTTQTASDLGEFNFVNRAEIKSTYVEISVTGTFYNEITGIRSFFPITLNAFANLARTQQINVNILTTIALKREKYLMVQGGKTYDEAKIQARNEILTVFKLPDGIISDMQDEDTDTFLHMDIGRDGVKNAVLLSLSIVLGNYTAQSISQVMQTIGNDIERDGVIDDPQYVDQLYQNSEDLNSSRIRTNLDQFFRAITAGFIIPNFEQFIEFYIRPYVKSPAPIFSLPTATYNQDISVELYDVKANAAIYYSVNRGAPMLYTDPIAISGNQTVMTISAYAVRPNMAASDPVTSYYFIDYAYDPAHYRTNMTIGDYQSSIVGTWVGHMEPPASYLSPDNVQITFDGSMQYTGQKISQFYGDSSGLSIVYYGWVGSELYYGTGAAYESKMIDIYSLNPNGTAVSNFLNVYNNGGGTTNAGRLDQMAMSDDLNHLRFELWSNAYPTPITFILTRLSE